METLEERCEYITEAGYYGTDGYFYTWDRNEAMSTLRIVDMISRLYADTYQYLALTDNGQLWRIKEIPVTAFEYDIEEEYVTDQFLTFNEILYTANEYYVPGTWSYQTRDGKYYNFDGKQLAGTKETPFVLNSADFDIAIGSEIPSYLYQLVDDGSKDGYYIVKNGCKILNHITDMIRHGNKVYAVREDGTLWDVTDRPKQVIEIVAKGYEKLPFLDTERGDWYWSSVDFVFQNDIMTGLNKCSFGPAQNLSRGQFATILYRMTGSPEVTYSSRFPDVPDGQFYTKPVLWASNEDVKVVNGYADGNFGPADLITREQMAVMMYRYAGHQGCDTSARADLSGYPDYKKVSDFSREAMEWAVAAGLISGNADKTLAPQGEASRAVCATIIMRFMEKF